MEPQVVQVQSFNSNTVRLGESDPPPLLTTVLSFNSNMVRLGVAVQDFLMLF